MQKQYIEQVIIFLRGHGLEVIVDEFIPTDTFMPYIQICNGVLRVNTTKTVVSDILHEAGHLMLCPVPLRKYLNNDLAKGMGFILENIQCEPDSELHWYLMAMDDPAVTAWAWAVGKHLGIPDTLIIEDPQYGGEGESIRTCLQLNSYIGIHSLKHAKYCDLPHAIWNKRDEVRYPKMKKWFPEIDNVQMKELSPIT